MSSSVDVAVALRVGNPELQALFEAGVGQVVLARLSPCALRSKKRQSEKNDKSLRNRLAGHDRPALQGLLAPSDNSLPMLTKWLATFQFACRPVYQPKRREVPVRSSARVPCRHVRKTIPTSGDASTVVPGFASKAGKARPRRSPRKRLDLKLNWVNNGNRKLLDQPHSPSNTMSDPNQQPTLLNENPASAAGTPASAAGGTGGKRRAADRLNIPSSVVRTSGFAPGDKAFVVDEDPAGSTPKALSGSSQATAAYSVGRLCRREGLSHSRHPCDPEEVRAGRRELRDCWRQREDHRQTAKRNGHTLSARRSRSR